MITGDITIDRILSTLHAPLDIRVKRHEAGHIVAAWMLWGGDAVRGTRVAGKAGGLSHFDIPDDIMYGPKNPAIVAGDCAVIILTAVRLESGGNGLSADSDTMAVSRELAPVAFRQLAKVGDRYDTEWIQAWIDQASRRVDDLLKDDYFWHCVWAVERVLDQAPNISGDGLRAVLAKVPREVKHARNPEA